jgi:hypothetical protein
MLKRGAEAKESDKALQKRVEELLDLFEEIQSSEEVPEDALTSFEGNYVRLPREGKLRLFEGFIHRFEIGREELQEELEGLLSVTDEDPFSWSRRLSRLRKRLESPRVKGFRRFVNRSGGLKFLLDFRADLLAAHRQSAMDLEPLDEDIAHLFNSWFQQGFLFLQEITQDSPYRQILFLKEHDMVHPMARIEEMGDRLGEDRRCFALYHRTMPEEPVVFIEVALTRGIARSIHDIIGEKQSEGSTKGEPDTAIFYSINNTQNGLAGLGLGKVLIFQVVDAIKRDRPNIKTFSTLSPLTGFWERYLKRILQGDDASFVLKRDSLGSYFSEKAKQALKAHFSEVQGSAPEDLSDLLVEILSDSQWIDDPVYTRLLKKPLQEIAYHYITQEKNRKGKPLNPVANFHLGNGASVSIRNVNFGANRSPRGLQDSCGLMVNYVYSRTWLQQIGSTMQSLLPWKG